MSHGFFLLFINFTKPIYLKCCKLQSNNKLDLMYGKETRNDSLVDTQDDDERREIERQQLLFA